MPSALLLYEKMDDTHIVTYAQDGSIHFVFIFPNPTSQLVFIC